MFNFTYAPRNLNGVRYLNMARDWPNKLKNVSTLVSQVTAFLEKTKLMLQFSKII